MVGKVELRASGEWAFDAVATRLVTGAVSDSVQFDVAVRVPPSDVDRADRLDVGAEVELSGRRRGRPPSGTARCSP